MREESGIVRAMVVGWAHPVYDIGWTILHSAAGHALRRSLIASVFSQRDEGANDGSQHTSKNEFSI